MKKISIVCVLVALASIFFSCEKETNILTKDSVNTQANTIQQNNSKDDGFLYGGDNIYGDGWIGWIDPKLVDPSDTIEYKNIVHGPANLKGESQNTGTEVLISCPTTGENCGELILVRPHRRDKVVGYYMLTN